MILTLDEYKKYLPLQTITNYNATITETHETRALYKWFVKYLGSELVEAISGESFPVALLAKIKPALANLAYFEALPFLNLVLTGSGFGVVSNPNMAPASTDRVKALAAGLLEAAHNFLDEMLIYLEANTETYTTWNQCSLNPGSLIPDAETFDSKLKINNSRIAFITLIPHIREVEVLQIGNVISDEFMQELILGSDANVKPLIQSACAYWAWERMMGQQTEQKEKFRDSDYIHSAKKLLYQKTNPVMALKNGEAYMLKAIEYLNKNLTTYTTYYDNAYEAPYENSAENGFFVT
jgi:hypothetical protein